VVEEGEEGNGKKRGRRKDFGEILPPVVLVLCAPPIFLVGVLRYGITHVVRRVYTLGIVPGLVGLLWIRATKADSPL
jgi:hypothetical protein